MQVFKCSECGREQATLDQYEYYIRHPSGVQTFESTTYTFECGHTVDSSEDLFIVQRSYHSRTWR